MLGLGNSMVALAIAPDTEAERLEALHEYRILDSEKDPAFQRIAEMACTTLSTASCAISFVDAERSWKKASIGWVIQDSPRDVSLSNYIMQKGETVVVSDALAHPEVSELLPVRQDVGRFYAGAPLVSPTGYMIGAIVVADPQPREDAPEIHEKLKLLADLAMDQLNLHRLRHEYDREARSAGETKWNYWKLWNFALDGITSFSSLPLRIWSYIGFGVSALAMAYLGWIVTKSMIFGLDVPGYASLMSVILFFNGISLIGILFFLAAAIMGLWLLVAILRKGKL